MLKSGSRGDEVRELQEKLNSLGYDAGTADGIFGPNTESALKAFQEASSLTADGVAGPMTLLRIDAAVKSAEMQSGDLEAVDDKS